LTADNADCADAFLSVPSALSAVISFAAFAEMRPYTAFFLIFFVDGSLLFRIRVVGLKAVVKLWP
jgi:hypothetical protein